MTTIITIGFIQALFFAILALSKKKKEVADYILAALFLTLCYQLAVNFIIVTDYREKFIHLVGTAGPMSMLYGPLLFFFIKNYISQNHEFKLKYLFHFVPFAIDHLVGFKTFYLQSGEEKLEDLLEIMAGQPDADLSIFLMLRSLIPILYCIWSIKVLTVHRKNLKNIYSFTSEKLTLDWLWYLAWSMLVVGVSAFLINATIVFFDVADWIQLRKIIVSISAIWIFFLGYYSIRKTPFYRSYHIEGVNTLEFDKVSRQPDKYERTRLKEEEIPELKEKLLEYLEDEKPYLNKNLTIGELAESIHVQTYQLSQLINDQLGKSFFELINSYRVEEVKGRFFDPKYNNLTLLGIAMECGFNSKASFNRIFKQHAGQTPTEYIKDKKAA
ncbi:MAG: helix-turn-helix transcriptional regulator [Cytophagales bacterium]|nr:helix-turn-helix transcriptional regulator [Cytophagales bacterium]